MEVTELYEAPITIPLNTDEQKFLMPNTKSMHHISDNEILIVYDKELCIIKVDRQNPPEELFRTDIVALESSVMRSYLRGTQLFLILYNGTVEEYELHRTSKRWALKQIVTYTMLITETILTVVASESLIAIITNRHAYIYDTTPQRNMKFRMTDFELTANTIAGIDGIFIYGQRNGHKFIGPHGMIDVPYTDALRKTCTMTSFKDIYSYVAFSELKKIHFGIIRKEGDTFTYNPHQVLEVTKSVCTAFRWKLTRLNTIIILREEGVIELWSAGQGEYIGECDLGTNRNPFHFGITPSGAYIYFYSLSDDNLHRLDITDPRPAAQKHPQEKLFE